MTIRVEIEGGPTLEFPDGTPQNIIQSKVKEITSRSTSQSKAVQLQDLLIRQARGEQGLQEQITQLREQAGRPDESIALRDARPIDTGLSEVEAALTAVSPSLSLPGLARGFKQGQTNIGLGALNFLSSMGLGDQFAKEIGLENEEQLQREIDTLRSVREQETEEIKKIAPGSALVGEVAGEVASLPLPSPTTIAPALGATGRIAGAAGLGAAQAAISASGRGQDVISSALTGAGFGAGFSGLTEAGGAIARRILNANQGKFSTEQIKDLIEAGKREGVDVFADDAAVSPLLRKLGVLAEDVPFLGTAPGRLKQSAQHEAAAERLLGQLKGDLDDFGLEAQKGLRSKLSKIKKVVGKKFSRVANELDPLGNIRRDNFITQIDDEIAGEVAKGTRANQSLIDILESFKKSPDGNFSVVRSQRSDLGDEISEFYKGDNKAIGGKGVERLQRVKNALESDIDDFVQSTGSQTAIKRFKDANKFVVDNLIPFKEGQLKNLIKQGAEPEAIMAFLRSGGGRESRAQVLFNGLNQKGRDAVKASIVDEAIRKATQGREGTIPLSANRFASELDKSQNAINVFFKGSDKHQIDGLRKLFRATARASQVAENPPTGGRLLIPGVGVTAITQDLGFTIAAAGGFGAVMKTILQTEAGKKVLLGLNRSTPGTQRFERFLEKANELIRKSAITAEQEAQQ